jgi:PleD family two-component response regulator
MPDTLLRDHIEPTVLVVDPSSANRALICDCLRQLSDVHTVATGDGELALRIFQDSRPSLVLLDTTPESLNGIALTRKIRAWEQENNETGISPWTPIVFLSSVTDEQLLAEGILAGGDDFLHKPVSEVVLLAKVTRNAAHRRHAAADIHAAKFTANARTSPSLDSLTGIPNRRHFDETLATEWKRCHPRPAAPLSLVHQRRRLLQAVQRRLRPPGR